MTHCLDDFTFLLRDDVATPSVPINDLLRNSDRVEDREIEVPKVVG
jgi:Asp-tRNA(Asn)/Glu-tRNA(Gln) amidotransferase C subunit